MATALVLSFVPAGVDHAEAQSPPACNTPECADRERLWLPAAQIHEIKNRFVAGVRQVTEAVAGTYGDEGPRLSASLDGLRRTLVQWDAAIGAYETMVSARPESAEGHVALGTVYLDRDRRDEALREFDAAGRLDPGRADVHSLSALAYGLAGKPSEAAAALRRASALDGGNPITIYAIAQQLDKTPRRDEATEQLRRFQESVWPQLRAQPARSPSAPFERVSLLRQVAGAAPIFPLHAYRSSFALLLAGKYDAAVAELDRAAAADPLAANAVAEHAAVLRRGQLPPAVNGLEARAAASAGSARSEALRLLGVAYWVDGQFDKSAARLAEAIELSPQDERSRLALADVLVEAGKTDAAEQTLAAAITAIPDSGQAHYRLGQLYQSRSLFPQAVREFEAAAALNPLVGLDRLYETIGGLYASQASFDSAVTAYLVRIDVNPNNGDAHKSLGEIYALQGRNDEALAEFAVSALIDPRQVGALVGASQVFLRLGRFDAALDVSTQALAVDARLKDARYVRAMSLTRMGRVEEGRRDLDLFARMQSEVMAATERQSELNTTKRDAAQHLRDRDYAVAVGLLRQAIVLDPNAATLHRDLGLALVRSGRYDEAVQALDSAIRLEDTADAHRLLADAYNALGRTADSEAQAALEARLTDRAKAERLQKMNGAR